MALGIRDIGLDDSNFDMMEDPTGASGGKYTKNLTPRDNSVKSKDENLKFKVDDNGKAVPVDDSGDTVRKRKPLNWKKIAVIVAIGFVAYKIFKK